MKNFQSLVVCSLLIASASTIAWAQAVSSAEISGTIQDSSGLAVPGATIKATQTDTGSTRTAISGADGTYALTSLPVGAYRLDVSKQGFAQYVQTGIVLQVVTNPTIDVALKVGSLTDTVQVEASAAMVETQS